jgi:hypothetical protein
MLYKLKLWLMVAAMSAPALAAHAQTSDVEQRDPAPSDQTLRTLLAAANDIASSIALNTQIELSDFELALMAGQTFRSGDKNTQTYTLRVCEVTNRTGGGMLTTSFRAKAIDCTCDRFELLYGVGNDRGVSAVAITPSSMGYLNRSCGHSVQIFR